jgi:predicted transcriptional regulator
MGDTKRKGAILRFRAALKAFESEIQAVIRELDEADEMDDTPTVRPPSQPSMEEVHVPKVEIVKLPMPGGRY